MSKFFLFFFVFASLEGLKKETHALCCIFFSNLREVGRKNKTKKLSCGKEKNYFVVCQFKVYEIRKERKNSI